MRVAFDREEELSVTGYRPAAELNVSLLPSAQGDLKALSLTAHADTGAAVNSTIAALARLIYPAEAKELVDFDVLSNLPPGAPFRGPGGPPMAFALEQAIDEAALRMKVDPIHLRKRWDPDPNRQRLYDWAAGLDVWRNRKPASSQSGRYRRGVGVASGYWLYLWQTGSSVELAIKGGRIIASCAVQDIGTGTRSVLANIVARESSLEPQDVEVRIGHSNLPEGPGSRRQPRHVLDRTADVARDREAESRNPTQRGAAAASRLECAVARIDRGLARSRRLRRTAEGCKACSRHHLAAAAGGIHGNGVRLDAEAPSTTSWSAPACRARCR